MLFFPEKSLYSEVCDELELQSEEFLVREIEIFTLIERERERERERESYVYYYTFHNFYEVQFQE